MPPKRNSNRGNKISCSVTNNVDVAVEDCVGDCRLPKEAMVNILSRLPVKTLVRFKAVCKPWLSLMTNPRFITLHRERFSHARKTLSTQVQSHHLRCPPLGIEPNMKITDPLDIFFEVCKGLICLARLSFTKEIVLWNPATNLWKCLPLSKANFGSSSRVSLGFGCNVQGDDYKVVRIFCSNGSRMKVGVEVYSSKSDSWKTVGVGFQFEVLSRKNHAIVNGNPYWIANIDEKSKIVEGKNSQVLLGFDATKMSFKIVPMLMPVELGMERERDGPSMPLVDWKGSLAVLELVRESINVWVFDEGAKEWRMKERFGGIGLRVERCMDGSGSGMIVVVCRGSRICVYDPVKKCVIEAFKMSKGDRCCFHLMDYNESLAYVKGMTSMLLFKEEDNINKNENENGVVAIHGFIAMYRGDAFYYHLAF